MQVGTYSFAIAATTVLVFAMFCYASNLATKTSSVPHGKLLLEQSYEWHRAANDTNRKHVLSILKSSSQALAFCHAARAVCGDDDLASATGVDPVSFLAKLETAERLALKHAQAVRGDSKKKSKDKTTTPSSAYIQRPVMSRVS